MPKNLTKSDLIVILGILSLFVLYSINNYLLLPIRFEFPLVGQASWYSRYDRGVKKRTANNEIFDDRAMTCAIWGVRFGRKLKVTNMDSGNFVVVRVNDRGPHRRYVREGRVIDLTKAAFKKISPSKRGLINVRVEIVP